MDKRVASYIVAEYTKIELLKETERSRIWLSKDNTGQIVILKHLNTTGLPFRKLKEISHPLWPRILFTAEEDGMTWVVEEYVSGNTLSAEIETGRRFSTAEVRTIMLQLLDGMAAFHRAGIIHRDIKPSNIILQGAKQVRLIDFEVSREMHREDTPDTRTLGTSGYAPPEQYGFGQTDARSDIYALGMTMKELLGEGCHGWLTSVLGKCTALDPKDRYQSADELREALLRPSYRRLSRIAAFFLAVCVILGIGYWVQRQELPPDSHVEQNTDTPAHIEAPVKESNPSNESASQDAPGLEESPSIHENAPIIPQPLPEVATETQKLSAEDIGLSLALGGENLGSGGKYHIDVPKNAWESWDTAGTTPVLAKYYPADWEILLTIENRGNAPIDSFAVEVNREDVQTIHRDTPILPGSSAQISIPMAGYKLQRNGNFLWLSFSSNTPHIKSASFTYSIWIRPEND